MAQVAVALNGRTYRFVCGDGEEGRIQHLADYVRSRMESLGEQFARAGDDRLLVMTALLLADELFEARGGAGGTEQATAQPSRRKAGPT